MPESIYTQENGAYFSKNPTWHVEDSPWKAKQILKMLSRNPIQPETIAEIGCGAGEILNQLYQFLPDNIHFTGYDISGQVISLAKEREKSRLQFKHADLLEEEVKFDLLLMVDVFEHVEDYLGFLRSCKNKSRYSIFHIPLDLSANSILRNSLMDVRKSVGHLHYYMKETALATLTDAGYEIVDFFYTSLVMDTPKKKISSKLASLLRNILYKANKDFAVKLMGGFSLLVLTRSE